MNVPRFWAKLMEMLLLAAPAVLLLLGVDIMPAIELLDTIVLLGASIVVAIRDLIQLVSGWFNVRSNHTLKQYAAMSYSQYETASKR